MHRSIPLCLLPLLALVCLNEISRSPHTHAAVLTVWCQSRRFAQGEIITTKPDGVHTYCGTPIGRFLAVKENLLFHLECPRAPSPNQATGVLIALTNRNTRQQTFGAQMLCEVQTPEAVTTGDNAYAIANRLVDVTVPYKIDSCDAQHYIEYLAYGVVLNPSVVRSFCPVFQPFNSLTSVNPAIFRLAGRESYYEWPIGGKGALEYVRPSRKGSRGKRKKSESPPKFKVVDKHGGGSGRGGGGGHGGESSGGTGGNTGGKGVPIVTYAGATRGHHSSASRSSKLFWRGWSWRSGSSRGK